MNVIFNSEITGDRLIIEAESPSRAEQVLNNLQKDTPGLIEVRWKRNLPMINI